MSKVDPDKFIDDYMAKVEEMASKNPEMVRRALENAKDGVGTVTLVLTGPEAMQIIELVFLKLCRGDIGMVAKLFAFLGVITAQEGIEGVTQFCDVIEQEHPNKVKLPRYFRALLTHICGSLQKHKLKFDEHGNPEETPGEDTP